MPSHHMLDRSALKFNQISIITLSLLGYVVNEPLLPVLVSVILIAGSAVPDAALFKLVYKHGVKPLGLMKPEMVHDSQSPHLFAQLVGGIVLTAGSVALYTGASVTGWLLVWIVVLLAAVNLAFGFCAGCFIYYQLGRLGVPGFRYEGGVRAKERHG